jgi:hypothetical protein
MSGLSSWSGGIGISSNWVTDLAPCRLLVPDAIASGIAATDDDDILSIRTDLSGHLGAGVDLVLLGQELHREMDAVEVTTWHRQIARLLRTPGEQNGIEVGAQIGRRDSFVRPVRDRAALWKVTDHHAGAEDDALPLHLLDPAIDVRFLHLEVGNAVAQQTADGIVLLEDGDRMARTRQLLGGSQTGRSGPDDGERACRSASRAASARPSLQPRRDR